MLPTVVQALSDSPDSHACILDFLRVLPEEVTEGRKITLTVCGLCESLERVELGAARMRDPDDIRPTSNPPSIMRGRDLMCFG